MDSCVGSCLELFALLGDFGGVHHFGAFRSRHVDEE